MERKFAVIEDNKVTNIVIGIENEVVAANPSKYIEYTNGWDYNNGIDGGSFFPPLPPVVEEPVTDSRKQGDNDTKARDSSHRLVR